MYPMATMFRSCTFHCIFQGRVVGVESYRHVWWALNTAFMFMLPLRRVWLSATPGTAAQQAPLSMGFPRQGYWSGVPSPPPGDLPDPGTELLSFASPALQVDSLPLSFGEAPVQHHTSQLKMTGIDNISQNKLTAEEWKSKTIQSFQVLEPCMCLTNKLTIEYMHHNTLWLILRTATSTFHFWLPQQLHWKIRGKSEEITLSG